MRRWIRWRERLAASWFIAPAKSRRCSSLDIDGALGDRKRQTLKHRYDIGIDVAFERHDQPWQGFQRQPFPLREFGLLGGDIDIAVLAQESHGDPFLSLAAIFAVQRHAQ